MGWSEGDSEQVIWEIWEKKGRDRGGLGQYNGNGREWGQDVW